MIEETVIVEKRKKGGQPGNQNAKKEFAVSMFTCKLHGKIKAKIREQAATKGISHGQYITLLVETDCG